MTFARKLVNNLSAWAIATLFLLVALVVSTSTLVAIDRAHETQTLKALVESQDVPISRLAVHSARPSALWIGDSFTQGPAAYPRIVCAELGWYCNIDAQGSTGYLNAGAPEMQVPTKRFIDRLPASIQTYKADVIIVDGGRNDFPVDLDLLMEAIRTYIAALHEAWPDAKLVIIVPFFMQAASPSDDSDLISGISAIAKSFGAKVLNPYAEKWFVGADIDAMQIEDHVHPNALGNSYIAAKLEESLELAQIITPGSSNGGLG
ncbi:SGNH/GDSL hydrolase family protein [Rhodococcus sp. ARC_M6]|uniref:SGNH/GDSL hydrolase family protein n=1 Tax=Rhodococcus sp. ARC_M6 TaxID=2928852 RepID=UPI001FB52A48|nr:SGNH/GDSL hydrolase family protein [Rhodococcus sp. ARC_M6]MCJ0904095.1 SGNH/GDSL hydrolase family protein [Rhodococcus sp. ARC_M6]